MRRTYLKTALAAMLLGSAAAGAWADGAWPAKPIRFAIPQAAGSANDVLARTLAEQLSRELKQAVVVENKPGANGSLAASFLLSQPADGYTLFMAGVSNLSWNPYLYSNLSYDPARDFDGVAVFADTPFVSIVSPRLGVKNFAQFKELVQKHPGKYTYASAGIGNSTHLATELIKKQVGLQMEHAPFNGAGSTTSVIAGDTPFMTTPPGAISEMIKSGKLVAVAVTGDKRLKALPDVPTYKELGYDVVVPGWYSIVAKKGTDPQIVKRLNQAINQALQTPAVQDRMQAQSLDAVRSQPSDVKAFMERDAKGWGALINELGIKQ
ncbi:tripartite tricarboxylate transporter substrate binding protein [Comamonas humi]